MNTHGSRRDAHGLAGWPKARRATGWALLVSATGIFYDEWSGWALGTNGSLGLVPAYLGMVVGLIGLTFVTWRVSGPGPGLLLALGTAGTFVFWFSYPSNASAGGLGALLFGVAVLFVQGRARFASPLWVSAGFSGCPSWWEPPLGGAPYPGSLFSEQRSQRLMDSSSRHSARSMLARGNRIRSSG